MNDLAEFNLKKLELVNVYKEYVALLEYLKFNDLHNIRKLNNLSNAHSEVADCQLRFTRYLTEIFNEKD